MPINIEIKARCRQPEKVLKILKSAGAEYRGIDRQVDTYFNVAEGRLKLREGNIENNLIFYKRSDQSGPKRSEVILYPAGKDKGLKEILEAVIGVKVIVDKMRHILFIENVKFHVDSVKGLGSFVEIEAIGEKGEELHLQRQCKQYIRLLGISEDDLVRESYSDLIINKGRAHE